MIMTMVSGLQVMDFKTSEWQEMCLWQDRIPISADAWTADASGICRSFRSGLSAKRISLPRSHTSCLALAGEKAEGLVPEATLHHGCCIYARVLHFSTLPSLHSHNVSAVDDLTGAVRYTYLDIRHELWYVSTIQIYVTQTLQGDVQSHLLIIDWMLWRLILVVSLMYPGREEPPLKHWFC